jgi:hypothetical protein
VQCPSFSDNAFIENVIQPTRQAREHDVEAITALLGDLNELRLTVDYPCGEGACSRWTAQQSL